MKRSVYFFLCLLAYASIYSQTNSLDVNYDTRSIALGESTVALADGYSMPDINPASLAAIKGASTSYYKRNIKWVESWNDMYYYSAGAAIKTGIGSFAFNYKQHYFGEVSVTSPANLDQYYKCGLRDNTFILSYAYNLFNSFDIGVNVKTFYFTTEHIDVDYDIVKSNKPVIFDIGFIYYINNIFPEIKDELNIGSVLQNYGTDLKIQYSETGDFTNVENFYEKVTRYWRLGFCYKIAYPSLPKDTDILGLILTGEYRNHLNPYNAGENDFWGFGLETSFFEMFSFRYGYITNPFSSIYGERGNFFGRYGFGMNLPMKKLGLKYSLAIAFDYSVIPIKISNSFIKSMKTKDFLDAFNFRLSWDEILF